MSRTLIWASDINTLADFYVQLFEAREISRDKNLVEVSSEFNSIIFHQITSEYLAEDSVGKQSQVRSDAAIKPIFTVPSISLALARIACEPSKLMGESFSYGIYLCQNLIDPEGNVIQIQEILIS